MTTLRRLLVLPVAVAALAAAGPAFGSTDVQITRSAFVPNAVEIRAGDAVSWVNRDTVDHKLASPAVKLESPTLTPTDNFAFTFPNAGTFTVTDPTNPSLTMTVKVLAAPVLSVTLDLAPRALIFGSTATLTGSLSTKAAGQPVAVEARPCKASGFQTLKTVTTGSGGSFSVVVKPLRSTVYRVRLGSGTSTVAARVRPKLTLQRVSHGRFVARLVGVGGKTLAVQTNRGTGWAPQGAAKLVRGTARFGLAIGAGTRVRVSIDSKSAGTCLETAVSNVVRG